MNSRIAVRLDPASALPSLNSATLSAPPIASVADDVEAWLNETYPLIEEQAAQEDAEGMWADEVGVPICCVGDLPRKPGSKPQIASCRSAVVSRLE